LEVFAPTDKELVSRSKALIDTGATITCVPESVIAELGRENLVATKKNVEGAFGGRQTQTEREAYVLNIKLDKCYFHDIEVVVLPPDKDYALIGRDILNDFSITFDGPNSSWQVDAKCK